MSKVLDLHGLIFFAVNPIIGVDVADRSIQMTRPPVLVAAPRYRLEVSTTRTETVAMVVEGSIEDLPRRAPFDHAPRPASTNPGLPRSPMLRPRESSRKLPDRRRK